MSLAAMTWATDARRTGKLLPAERLVLVVLADYASADTAQAYPGAATIAARLGMTERYVRKCLVSLMELGMIRAGDQRVVSHYQGGHRPMVYVLNVDGRPEPQDTPGMNHRTPQRPEPQDTPGVNDGVAMTCPTVPDWGVPQFTQTKSRTNNRTGTEKTPAADAARCDVDHTDVEAELTLIEPTPTRDPMSGFTDWWQAYPRKVAKAAAIKAWPTAVKEAGGVQPLIDGLARSQADWAAQRRPTFKIPHPATWLNGKRWEDEHTTDHNPRRVPDWDDVEDFIGS